MNPDIKARLLALAKTYGTTNPFVVVSVPTGENSSSWDPGVNVWVRGEYPKPSSVIGKTEDDAAKELCDNIEDAIRGHIRTHRKYVRYYRRKGIEASILYHQKMVRRLDAELKASLSIGVEP
jgi:hypothetical protein